MSTIRGHRKAISRDGFYTPAISLQERFGLHLTGREKW